MERKDIPFEDAGVENKSLEEMIRILEEMDSVDDVALYRRVRDTVMKKHRHRKRLVFLRNAAAVIIPILLIAVGVWLYTDRPLDNSVGVITQHTGVPKLIMLNGEECILTDDAMSRIAEESHGMIQNNNGALVFSKRVSQNNVEEIRYYGIEVPVGTKIDIILEDGTRVWVNANSSLRYPSSFADNERRVHLEGEAYFEVSADAQKLFVVETSEQELTVLGTEFNISAYKEDQIAYTTLINGKLSLKSADSKHEITLQPGMQAQLRPDSGFSQHRVKTDDIIAWRNDVIIFEGNTLGQIMRKLARIYDAEFVFEHDALRDLHTYGSMPVQKDLAVLLKLIEASGRVKFEIEGNKVVIKAVE